MSVLRKKIIVRGVVQGVGFRPFVWTLAHQFHCSGSVCNDAHGVTIEVQGTRQNLEGFITALSTNAPALAVIKSLDQQVLPTVKEETSFRILDSQIDGPPTASVSPDMAICADCLDELRDPDNRRFAYPFINCTNCGPRFTIQISVPFDREHSTMRGFAMCAKCLVEYSSPAERRFHAQPNACHHCGPAIWYLNGSGDVSAANKLPKIYFRDGIQHTMHTVNVVRQVISAGKVVAIKGVGGFHLACDARNVAAVNLLRKRKRRRAKPLAVMVADLETAASIAQLEPASIGLLEGPQRPIVLLKKQIGSLPEAMAPCNPYVGVMLPYSPLHHLLLRRGDVWVMTSGNLADEPIAFENADAMDRLANLADGFLLHNRPIHAVCDDSVWRVGSDASKGRQAFPIRRSRGYAPLAVDIDQHGEMDPPMGCLLAVGGEQKMSLCLTVGPAAVMGQHIGDMGNRETLVALEASCAQLLSLYQASPRYVVADQHPGYLSVAWAKQQAARFGARFLQVQHHHAHAAALIAERGLPATQPIIACVFDGTGYGTDGAIWGGEILVASALSWRRAAHLSYLPLPGGDSCIRKPAKTALAFLHAARLPWKSDLPCVRYFTGHELQILRRQLERGINTVLTSSMGRLFDAVASLLGLRNEIDYEGQAALELESLADLEFDQAEAVAPYRFQWTTDSTPTLGVHELLRQVCRDLDKGKPPGTISARFHQTIASATVDICLHLRSASRESLGEVELGTVGLTGGTFQNMVLTRLVRDGLERSGFQCLTHRTVPPNDGGLALGQAMVAKSQMHQTILFQRANVPTDSLAVDYPGEKGANGSCA
ncbi:carbamoyltransferase HypF [Planctomycetaceae bacterium SH139]